MKPLGGLSFFLFLLNLSLCTARTNISVTTSINCSSFVLLYSYYFFSYLIFSLYIFFILLHYELLLLLSHYLIIIILKLHTTSATTTRRWYLLFIKINFFCYLFKKHIKYSIHGTEYTFMKRSTQRSIYIQVMLFSMNGIYTLFKDRKQELMIFAKGNIYRETGTASKEVEQKSFVRKIQSEKKSLSKKIELESVV